MLGFTLGANGSSRLRFKREQLAAWQMMWGSFWFCRQMMWGSIWFL
jgi:hypothetical protein